MANFGIIRIQKLKSAASVRSSLKHALREQDTPNADPVKTPENERVFSQTVDEAIERFNDRLATQKKVRSNAVRCVEFLVTASPEAMAEKTRAEQDAYFRDAIRWIEDKHGKENVIFAGVHRDESTPHLTAFVVPIDHRGKLCCKSFYGGSKHVLSDLQTEFTEQVAKNHALERGKHGSKAAHKKISTYYRELNKTASEAFKSPLTAKDVEPRIIEKSFWASKKESFEGVARRLNKKVELEAAKGLHRDREQAREYRRLEPTLQLIQKYNLTVPLLKLAKEMEKEAREKAELVRKQREEQIRQSRKIVIQGLAHEKSRGISR